MVIEAGLVRDGPARVAGRARELQRLRPVEGRREADFADFLGVDLERRKEDGCEL